MGGELPHTPLGNLCDPERGITYGIVKVGDFVVDGVPVIRGGDIQNGRIVFDEEKRVTEEVSRRFQRTILRGGEIIINLIAEPGHTAIVPPELARANVSRDVGVIALNNTVDHRYVGYCLKSPAAIHWLTSRLQGSVTQKINLATLRDLPIPTPPLEEQHAIAYILSTLDDKIELNRRLNETLEAIAHAIFKSWFVDFDPVRAKMEGRQPAGIDAERAALFLDALEDSPLGKIPKGWQAGTLGDVAQNPRRVVQPSEIGDGTPYIALEHMPRRSIALGEWSSAENVASAKFEYRRYDILFGKLRPYFHKVGVAATDGVCSTDILVVAPKRPEFFGLVLGHVSSDELVQHADAVSTGTKMPRVNWKDLAKYPIALPSPAVARRFDAIVRPLIDRTFSGILESRNLAVLRDTLLPKLLSGDIRVKTAEKAVERVV